MQTNYREARKTELHVHLEGSVEPETLHELAPEVGIEEARARFRFSCFQEFLQGYIWCIGYLTRPEHYALITRRLLERLERERVDYAEITLSAGVVLRRGQDFAAVFDAIHEEASHSRVKTRWVLDTVRQWGVEPARDVLKLALDRKDRGVVAFGVGGDEVAGPIEWFGDVMKEARDGGLRLTIHAGEADGADSVWRAVRLGAERIGHGIRSADDPSLLDYLRERQIPLEVCITSNVATGVVPSLEAHPVRRIYDAGVPIVLATDDPAMFHTTLENEYEVAAREFGFTNEELLGIVENGFRFAFDR